MTATENRPFRPAQAQNIEETGLPPSLVSDLVLKHVFFEGSSTLGKLALRSKLSPTVIHSIYRQFQKEHLCETRGATGDDYEIFLSKRGREMAEIALQKSHYAGPAPVPLADYNRAVEAQGMQVRVTAESLNSMMSDLVLPAHVIRELGTALVTGGAIVLYGSTGNGKTSIAERLHRVSNDLIYVPYAVEVSGQILTVFDPLIHLGATQDTASEHSRWILCRRPMVKVGGEMRAEILDPRVDEMTRIGIAPVQMKANNGILFIDDFGRQRITPRELLNRWIVPLDRGTDVLSLWSGVNFEIPFHVLVVFATNLDLGDLAEDAFMRRLKNKIKIEPLDQNLFRELLRRVSAEKGVPCSPQMEDYIVEECSRHSPDGLRACFPVDLMAIIAGISRFEQRAPVLEKADVEQALNLYFLH
jgi:predicted ATPase with chaperone activity